MLSDADLNNFLTLNAFLAAMLVVLCTMIVRAINQHQQYQLTNLAVRDKLTNLYNRLYFYNFFDQYRHKAEREHEPYCIALADIDNFKSINDTFGHSTGDEILRSVAKLLSEQLRYEDVVVRWGGEEFLIVLVNCELAAAAQKIDNVRNHIAMKLSDLVDTGDQQVTLSFGLVFPEPNESLTSVLSRSDKLLYQAKQAGKNCVVF